MYQNPDKSVNWNAVLGTVAVLAVGIVTAEIVRGQLAKTDLGKKLLAIS